MRLILAAMMLAAAVPAWARLGETEAQLQVRYGKPESTNEVRGLRVVHWDFKGRQVAVVLRTGKSAMEIVTASSTKDVISPDQAKAIASSISGATNWANVKLGKMFQEGYLDRDGKERCFFVVDSPLKPAQVFVTTKTEMDLQSVQKKRDDEAAASGF